MERSPQAPQIEPLSASGVPLRFFNPWNDVRSWSGKLPHWEQAGVSYFITWRLADALPAVKLKQFDNERKTWLANRGNPLSSEEKEDYHRLFSRRIDLWLDAGMGSCKLRDPAFRGIVDRAIRHFHPIRYVNHCHVIMPNHVHVLVSLASGTKLESQVHSWKSYTASEWNRRNGGSGVVWQKEYFDRIIRDSNHFRRCVRYIRNNPAKADLADDSYSLFEGELAKSIQ